MHTRHFQLLQCCSHLTHSASNSLEERGNSVRSECVSKRNGKQTSAHCTAPPAPGGSCEPPFDRWAVDSGSAAFAAARSICTGIVISSLCLHMFYASVQHHGSVVGRPNSVWLMCRKEAEDGNFFLEACSFSLLLACMDLFCDLTNVLKRLTFSYGTNALTRR